MGKVLKFPGGQEIYRRDETPVDKLLEQAKTWGMKDCFITGVNDKGVMGGGTNTFIPYNVFILLKVLKQLIEI